MNETKAKTTDISVLNERILVSDEELAILLGTGKAAARKLAVEAGAVCHIGKKTKRNNLALVKDYLQRVSDNDN